MAEWPQGNIATPQPRKKGIDPRTIDEALRRIRQAERDARRAANLADTNECYAALERCQHAAFDAKALFNGGTLPDEGER